MTPLRPRRRGDKLRKMKPAALLAALYAFLIPAAALACPAAARESCASGNPYHARILEVYDELAADS